MSSDRLIIFDTTMRDGEQSPGATMDKEEKIRIAKALERMRVDVIVAGFAIASPGDFDAVNTIASLVKDSRICSLARAVDADIDRAGEALKPANAELAVKTFFPKKNLSMKYANGSNITLIWFI